MRMLTFSSTAFAFFIFFLFFEVLSLYIKIIYDKVFKNSVNIRKPLSSGVFSCLGCNERCSKKVVKKPPKKAAKK